MESREVTQGKYPHRHKIVPVKVWIDADEGVANLVARLNTLPGISTPGLCSQGRPGDALGRPFVMVMWKNKSARARLSPWTVEPWTFEDVGVLLPRPCDLHIKSLDNPRKVPVKVWENIDAGIALLVVRLNKIPGIRTWSSCQGDLDSTEDNRPFVLVRWTNERAREQLLPWTVKPLGDGWELVPRPEDLAIAQH
jgi:hypothetical protein